MIPPATLQHCSPAAAATPSPRLVHAAHEFEAQLVKELLKPLADGWSSTGDDNTAAGVLGDFASEALGQAISNRGGFGIAQRLIAEVAWSGDQLHQQADAREHSNISSCRAHGSRGSADNSH